MTKFKPNTRHHFIPQCYLRHFANTKRGIYAYDKLNSNNYYASIDKVCCIDDFYKISSEFLNEEYDCENEQLIIENEYFSKEIEPKFAKVLDWIDKRKNICLADENKNVGLSYRDKLVIAKHIVIQFFRLPDIKYQNQNMSDSIIPQMIDLFKEGISMEHNNDIYKNINVKYKCDPALLHAQSTFLNDELVNHFAAALAENYWSFLVSIDGKIYTSDFPLVVEPHISNATPINLGLTQYGSELTYPLTKNIVLTIWDKNFFSEKARGDCKFYTISEKEERRQNRFRYYYAKRYVFSFIKDFYLIDSLLKKTSNGKQIFKGIIEN